MQPSVVEREHPALGLSLNISRAVIPAFSLKLVFCSAPSVLPHTKVKRWESSESEAFKCQIIIPVYRDMAFDFSPL